MESHDSNNIKPAALWGNTKHPQKSHNNLNSRNANTKKRKILLHHTTTTPVCFPPGVVSSSSSPSLVLGSNNFHPSDSSSGVDNTNAILAALQQFEERQFQRQTLMEQHLVEVLEKREQKLRKELQQHHQTMNQNFEITHERMTSFERELVSLRHHEDTMGERNNTIPTTESHEDECWKERYTELLRVHIDNKTQRSDDQRWIQKLQVDLAVAHQTIQELTNRLTASDDDEGKKNDDNTGTKGGTVNGSIESNNTHDIKQEEEYDDNEDEDKNGGIGNKSASKEQIFDDEYDNDNNNGNDYDADDGKEGEQQQQQQQQQDKDDEYYVGNVVADIGGRNDGIEDGKGNGGKDKILSVSEKDNKVDVDRDNDDDIDDVNKGKNKDEDYVDECDNNANDTDCVFLDDEDTNSKRFKSWEGRYEILKKYVESHNGRLPVQKYNNEQDGFALGMWTAIQRTYYRKNKHGYDRNQPMANNQSMTKPRATKLEKIPNWMWEQRVLWSEQRERRGRDHKPPIMALNTVPNTSTKAMDTVPNISIDVNKSWLRHKNYNESLDEKINRNLSQKEKQHADDGGEIIHNESSFQEEDVNDWYFRHWEKRYRVLQAYCETHNGKIPPVTYNNNKIDGFSLGSWVHEQRRTYRDIVNGRGDSNKSLLTKPRVEQLEKINNWTWRTAWTTKHQQKTIEAPLRRRRYKWEGCTAKEFFE